MAITTEKVFPLHRDRSGQADDDVNTWLQRRHFNVFDEDANAEMSEDDMREKNEVRLITYTSIHAYCNGRIHDLETYATLITNFVGYKHSRFQGKNKEPRLRSLLEEAEAAEVHQNQLVNSLLSKD